MEVMPQNIIVLAQTVSEVVDMVTNDGTETMENFVGLTDFLAEIAETISNDDFRSNVSFEDQVNVC